MRVVIFILIISFSGNLFALTMAKAIDEAGRQRMLSQKMAKAFFMRAIKGDSSSARYQMDISTERFEYNLQELKEFEPAASLRPQLAALEILWREYQFALVQPVTASSAERVLSLSDGLLREAHQYVQNLQKLAGTPKARLINVSGRQRMLSQRMAKNFLASVWREENVDVDSAFYKDLGEFEQALNFLLQSPDNTEVITQKLLRVKSKLEYASRAFDGGLKLSENSVMVMVTGTTDSVLYKMDEITRLYSEL